MSTRHTTIYVSGLSPTTNENALLSAFQPFGEIVEIHLPKHRNATTNGGPASTESSNHRGFGFIVFSSAEDVEGAIDNMHLNEIEGRVITVTPAKPIKSGTSLNSAGFDSRKPVWEDEEWIKQYGGGQDEVTDGTQPADATTA
ncbi:RNA-binding domain-containing protein [Meira miltonrushii]|uniref:RNA-binding domain-containing protein n=1 Tax=Meira miltonrushii TaxID=1280837 RepID=A0A316VPP0_9BASI|nr:RNA-binding domain-containing protein [Meira miltonrushii]PWN38121.1 RNA-binding domain-containing protein [Meira miltonrushii]